MGEESRGDEITVKLLPDPDDPVFDRVYGLLETSFTDPEIYASKDGIRSLLKSCRHPGLSHHCLVAYGDDDPVGVSLYYYVEPLNIGYGTELVIHPDHRGRGIARRLFDARLEDLNRRAHEAGNPDISALIIDCSNPNRMTPEQIEADRNQGGIDPTRRREIWDHFGYRLIQAQHVLPHSDNLDDATHYLDLAYLPLNQDPVPDHIPASTLTTFYRLIWSEWLGEKEAESLLEQVEIPEPVVPLGDLTDL